MCVAIWDSATFFVSQFFNWNRWFASKLTVNYTHTLSQRIRFQTPHHWMSANMLALKPIHSNGREKNKSVGKTNIVYNYRLQPHLHRHKGTYTHTNASTGMSQTNSSSGTHRRVNKTDSSNTQLLLFKFWLFTGEVSRYTLNLPNNQRRTGKTLSRNLVRKS